MEFRIEQASPYALPMELLLLADPSPEAVKGYIAAPDVRAWSAHAPDSLVVGVLLARPVPDAVARTLEVLNLAVRPEAQRQGIARALMNRSLQYALREGFARMRIATADSSKGPLALYRQLGYAETAREAEYFLRHYPEPIFEFGRQAVDRIVLEKRLSAGSIQAPEPI